MLYPRDPLGERAFRWTKRLRDTDGGWIGVVSRLVVAIIFIAIVLYLANHH